MDEDIRKEIDFLSENGRLQETKSYTQHGINSVYDHCVSVTLMSVAIAKHFNIKVDEESLIRGAMLHDYFLYDWHVPDNAHRLHGFTHPYTALARAEQDYDLTPTEKDIIKHHMFPLVPFPPCSKEAWIVCAADKICAFHETVSPYRKIIYRNAHS